VASQPFPLQREQAGSVVSKPTEPDVAALRSEAVFGHGFLH
jgi:hypothetical protein